jgi:hypothetical protein
MVSSREYGLWHINGEQGIAWALWLGDEGGVCTAALACSLQAVEAFVRQDVGESQGAYPHADNSSSDEEEGTQGGVVERLLLCSLGEWTPASTLSTMYIPSSPAH